MLKRYLCTLLLLQSTVFAAFAQSATPANEQDETPAPFIGSEIIFGHGLLPLHQMFAGFLQYVDYSNTTASGAISLTYRYHLSRVVSLGVTGVLERETGQWQTHQGILTGIFDPYDIAYGRFSRSTFTVAPEVTFNYGETAHGMLRFYSVVALGITRSAQTTTLDNPGSEYSITPPPASTKVYTTFQATPIGIRVGRALGGFAELGIGYKGIFNYGLTYRF
ncbi:hypothetical protein GCM10023093_19240 [Nemorincola caseinilytica]|uniref:Outer membrane protein beta-barrel domain-containing protein n=1 Tax=Nemorincola caseinilytica TaxID=2054315 RepID=A0ABP8NF84_9BACT